MAECERILCFGKVSLAENGNIESGWGRTGWAAVLDESISNLDQLQFDIAASGT